MIIVVFMPGTRSTLTMEILRRLGANLVPCKIDANLFGNRGVQDALSKGTYKLVERDITKPYFCVETPRLETEHMGTGVDSEAYAANDAIKIIALPGIQKCKLTEKDRVVFLVRKPTDTCRSQKERGFLRAHRLNYHRFVWHFEEWAKSAPCPVMYFDTDKLMSFPVDSVKTMADFCQLPGDPVLASNIVDPTLVRESDPESIDEAFDDYQMVKSKCL